MRLLSLLTFCALAALSAALILLLVLFGMAPGVRPLDYTGLFMYGPGPGFFLLPIWLCLAVLARVAAVSLGRRVAWAAWVGLGLLLALQALMIADFRGLIWLGVRKFPQGPCAEFRIPPWLLPHALVVH